MTGRDYQTFDKFLKEMEFWKLRKDKKIRDRQNEIIQQEFESG